MSCADMVRPGRSCHHTGQRKQFLFQFIRFLVFLVLWKYYIADLSSLGYLIFIVDSNYTTILPY